MAPNMRNRMGNCPHERKEIHDQVVLNGMLGPGSMFARTSLQFGKHLFAVCQTSRPPTIAVYRHAPAFESSAFAITLTELRAMAALATTGLEVAQRGQRDARHVVCKRPEQVRRILLTVRWEMSSAAATSIGSPRISVMPAACMATSVNIAHGHAHVGSSHAGHR